MSKKWYLDNLVDFLRWSVYITALINPTNSKKMTVLYNWGDAVYAFGTGSRRGRWQLRIPGSRAGAQSAELSSWRLHHQPQPHSLLIIYYIAVKSPPDRGHTHDRGLPGPRAVAVSLLAAHRPSLCLHASSYTLFFVLKGVRSYIVLQCELGSQQHRVVAIQF